MKERRKTLRAFGLFLSALLMLLLPFETASAATAIDVNKKTSLSLSYANSGVVLSGVSVHLYPAAYVSAVDDYSLTEDFKDSAVNLANLDTDTKWSAAAKTLSAYAAANSISPLAETVTDAKGAADFKPLSTGLYLVVSDSVTIGDTTYTIDPFLVSLPSLNEKDEWVYDVSASPKSVSHQTVVGGKVRYKVVKQWVDAGYESERPDSVTVKILKNGELFTTQILNGDNNWSYSWQADDDGSVWQASEQDVPASYTVTSEMVNREIVVTNTYAPTTPGDTTTRKSTLSGVTTSAPKTGDSTRYSLITILAVSGMILLLFGIGQKRGREARNHEKE